MLSNTTRITLITFFSALYFYSHVGTLYLQTRGLNLAQVNALTAVIVATIFLAEVPTGVLADRIGPKWSIVLALVLQAIGEIWYVFASTFPVFVVIAIIAGLGFAFASGATEALIYDSLPRDDRENRMQQAMGNVGSAYHLAFFLAPLVGGLLVSEYVLDRFLLVIALTACSVLVALLISLTLQAPRSDTGATRPAPLAILRAGLAEVRQQPALRHILLLTVFTTTFLGVLASLYQPYFVNLELSPFLVGAGLSLGGLLAAVIQKNVYRLSVWWGPSRAMIIATLLPGVMYLVLALAMQPALGFVALVLTYGVLEMRKPLFSAYQNQFIADQNRATTLSLINMFTSLYLAVMAVVFGLLADQSVRLAFAVMGTVIILAALSLRVDRLGTRNSSEL
jgi:MFS family permease